MLEHKSTTHASRTGLKGRGWTDALIRRYLPEGPDELAVNPVFRTRSPMQLFALERVEGAEHQPAFIADAERARARRASAQARAEQARARLIARAQDLPLVICQLDWDELRARAIQSHNACMEARELEGELQGVPRPEMPAASENSDPGFLARIMVNYVRQHLTAYDRHVRGWAGQVGGRAAQQVVRWRICALIGAHYPELREEALRQAEQRRDLEARLAERRGPLRRAEAEQGPKVGGAHEALGGAPGPRMGARLHLVPAAGGPAPMPLGTEPRPKL